jgi:hypothetical protein
MSNRQQPTKKFTAEDVRQMLSNPLYGYGINLVPTERVTEAVMQLNTKLAQAMHDTGEMFTLNKVDQHFQALFLELEKSGTCTREEDYPPLVSKDLWLQAQLKTVEKLSRGEPL